MSESKIPIRLKVNGAWREFEVRPLETLADVLRRRLHLTGTKVSCERGECGACTVLLDRRPVHGCLVLAASISGHDVTTIEGLADQGSLDPIQEAFVEKDASQCGYCTPGMIMAAKGLLLRSSDPTDEEVKDALSGNICRCTGYAGIHRAVKAAAVKHRR